MTLIALVGAQLAPPVLTFNSERGAPYVLREPVFGPHLA